MRSDRCRPTGGDIRREIANYIRDHFADLLGDRHCLLDTEEGVDELLDLVRSGRISRQL